MMDKFTTMEQVEAYTAGEQIQCLECNKWFAFLGNHLRRAHGLSNDEYRERYALPAMTPLAGQAYRRAHREKLQRMQADGTIDYLHLPAATEKAAAAAKPKIGVAKIQHANLIAQLRPGDHHKINPGGKRADGRDADHEREMQQLRRQAAPTTPASAFPEVIHQDRIKSVMERLVIGGTTKSPKLWICRQMEITMSELDSWLKDSGELGAVTPPKYAIKYMVSLVPNSGGRANRFTPEEDAYLVANFPGRGGAKICANALNRSIHSIRIRARVLGLRLKLDSTSAWTDDHIAILQNHYLVDGAEYVSEKTGHTVASVKLKASKSNLTRRRLKGTPWTSEQDAALKECHTLGDIKKAARIIGRTGVECISRAKILGITVPKSGQGRPQKSWTAEQDNALREHYKNGKIGGDVRKITGHSYAQCAKRAKELGILPTIHPGATTPLSNDVRPTVHPVEK